MTAQKMAQAHVRDGDTLTSHSGALPDGGPTTAPAPRSRHAVTADGVIAEKDGTKVILFDDRGTFDRDVQKFGAGLAVTVTVKPVVKSLTDQQRKFYRGFVVPIFAEWMGEPDLEEVHQILAWRFLRIEDHPTMGTPRRKSTARGKMTDAEMCDYLDRLMAWGTVSHGLRFPEREAAA